MVLLKVVSRLLSLVLLANLAALVAACSSSSPPAETRGVEPSSPPASQVVSTRVIYTPPSSPPAPPAMASGDGRPAESLRDVAEALRNRGVTLTQFDPERGFLAATVSRNPQEYIDCGWIVQLASDGSMQQYPAASPRLRLRSDDQGQASTSRQLLEMEARIVVTAASTSANRVQLVGGGDFVLIKTIGDELAPSPQREVIYFKSGQRDNFPEDMVCQSTGRLEREILNIGLAMV